MARSLRLPDDRVSRRSGLAGRKRRLDHQRSRARTRARDAPCQRRHHGGRGHHHRRRSAADRPHRTASAPAAAARDPGFATAPAARLARGQDGTRRCHRLLLLRRGEQAARTGSARRRGRTGSDATPSRRRHHPLPRRRARRRMAAPIWTACWRSWASAKSPA